MGLSDPRSKGRGRSRKRAPLEELQRIVIDDLEVIVTVLDDMHRDTQLPYDGIDRRNLVRNAHCPFRANRQRSSRDVEDRDVGVSNPYGNPLNINYFTAGTFEVPTIALHFAK